MAKFIIGFAIGAYAGAMARENYYFPSPEKIEQVFRIYKKNEKIDEKNYSTETKETKEIADVR